jgi:hypothetical protein
MWRAVGDLQTYILGGGVVTVSAAVVYAISVTRRPYTMLIVFRAVNTPDSPRAPDIPIFTNTVVVDSLCNDTQDLGESAVRISNVTLVRFNVSLSCNCILMIFKMINAGLIDIAPDACVYTDSVVDYNELHDMLRRSSRSGICWSGHYNGNSYGINVIAGIYP